MGKQSKNKPQISAKMIGISIKQSISIRKNDQAGMGDDLQRPLDITHKALRHYIIYFWADKNAIHPMPYTTASHPATCGILCMNHELTKTLLFNSGRRYPRTPAGIWAKAMGWNLANIYWESPKYFVLDS